MANPEQQSPTNSDSPNPSAETEQLDGDGGNTNNHIPSDPLLGTGSFIDPETTHHASENGIADNIGPTGSNQEEPVAEVSTPVSATATATAADADATPASRRNRKTLNEVQAEGRPDWLPPGWIVDCRVRSSGATMGTVDKYFKDPFGRRFRSKNEVINFLETGSKTKKKQAPDGDNKPSESSSTGSRKKKNPASKSKEPAGILFDFNNIPEKVTWTLEDADENQWSASIDGERVPEETQKQWTATFDWVCNNYP